MHNPKIALQQAYKILKKDGLLFIRVPNKDDETLPKYYEILHSYEFNKKILDKLLVDVGFEKNFIDNVIDDKKIPMDLLYKKI